MWLVNKINAAQPLILADVCKYVASNPQLQQSNQADASSSSSTSAPPPQNAGGFPLTSPSKSSSSSSSSSPTEYDKRKSIARQYEEALPDEASVQEADAASQRKFAQAAAVHYLNQLQEVEPLLQARRFSLVGDSRMHVRVTSMINRFSVCPELSLVYIDL
jgi:hypothetical protein